MPMIEKGSPKILILIVFCLIALTSFVNAQVKLPGNISLNTDVHDFGDILEGNPRVADFILTNTGTEEVFMLRADVPENCVYRYSAPKVLPGQTTTIRIKINPTHMGSFRENINVFTSASGKSFKLYLTGNVKFVDHSGDLSCPDFNQPVEEKQVNQDFTVQVIDRATSKPISNARVSFEPNPNIIPFHLTNTDGITKNTLPIDLYDINVDVRDYEPSSQTIYVGKGITSTIFLLDKLPHPHDSTIFAQKPKEQTKEPVREPEQKDESTPKNTDTTKHTPIKDQVIHEIDEVFKPGTKKPPKAPAEKKDSVPVFKENPGELPATTYAPNNIVFLLDISSSMATPERLPLVKIAMKNLLNSLRSIDRVCIVTYASGTNLALESTLVENKAQIATVIDKLVAHGTTDGGKGIREAYRVAAENYIKEGNNQIIIATDGDFNLDKSDEALYRFIKHKAEGGISMSVVGVASIPRALKQMQIIADKGQGSFIHITSKEQAASVLIDEIKARSLKK